MSAKTEYCNCKDNNAITTGYEDDFGYWDVCLKCRKKIKYSYHEYNHYYGEDHELFWGPNGEIVD